MENTFRKELLERIETSRKFGWTGGFEPRFLADFVENNTPTR